MGARITCHFELYSLQTLRTTWMAQSAPRPWTAAAIGVGFAFGRDAQPALVIGRHYITERDSAPVQYNGIVQHGRYWYTNVLWLPLVVANQSPRLRIPTSHERVRPEVQ